MDIRALDSLIQVIEQGSIAAAARQMQLTPAAISQRISTLEQALNCQLLDRSSHKARPTQAAQNLLPRAKHIVQQAMALRGDVDQSGLAGQIRIGAVDSVLSCVMPNALAELKASAPKAHIHIVPGTSASLFERLQQQQIDIAISVRPPFKLPKALHCQPLYQEAYALIAGDKTDRDITRLLIDQPYIRYDPNSWGGKQVDDYLQQQGIQPNTIADMDALITIVQMVSAGMGVSIIPLWPGVERQYPDLQLTPLTVPTLNRTLCAIHPYHPNQPKLNTLLINALQRHSNLAL